MMSKALVKRLRLSASYYRRSGKYQGNRPSVVEEAATEIEQQDIEIVALRTRLAMYERIEKFAMSAAVDAIVALPESELRVIIATMVDDSKAKAILLDALHNIESSLSFGSEFMALEKIDDARKLVAFRGHPEIADEIRKARAAVFYPDRG